jgi:hypothetical protein
LWPLYLQAAVGEATAQADLVEPTDELLLKAMTSCRALQESGKKAAKVAGQITQALHNLNGVLGQLQASLVAHIATRWIDSSGKPSSPTWAD